MKTASCVLAKKAKIAAMAALLSTGFCQFSCSPTLLKNDFKQETLNTLPLRNIPGSPVGDSVQYISDYTTQNVKVVQFSPYSKGLELNSIPVNTTQGGHYDWLTFKAIPTTKLKKPIQFKVFIKLTELRDRFIMDLGDEAVGTYSRVQIERGGALTVLESFEPSAKPVILGTLNANQDYLLSFTVDSSKNRCRAVVFGKLNVDGTEQPSVDRTTKLISSQPQPATGPLRPSMSYKWDEGIRQSKLLFADVSITQ